MNNQNQFISNDLTMISTLICFGETMVDVRKNINGDVEFIFNQSPNLQELIKAFSLNELSVNPRQFSVVLKDVKRIIYSQKNNH